MDNKIFDNRFKEILKGLCGIFVYLFFNLASGAIVSAFGVNVSELSQKQSALISMFISFIVVEGFKSGEKSSIN